MSIVGGFDFVALRLWPVPPRTEQMQRLGEDIVVQEARVHRERAHEEDDTNGTGSDGSEDEGDDTNAGDSEGDEDSSDHSDTDDNDSDGSEDDEYISDDNEHNNLVIDNNVYYKKPAGNLVWLREISPANRMSAIDLAEKSGHMEIADRLRKFMAENPVKS